MGKGYLLSEAKALITREEYNSLQIEETMQSEANQIAIHSKHKADLVPYSLMGFM